MGSFEFHDVTMPRVIHAPLEYRKVGDSDGFERRYNWLEPQELLTTAEADEADARRLVNSASTDQTRLADMLAFPDDQDKENLL